MIIVLFGQPGSGKTTIAERIQKEIGGLHLDGDILRKLFDDKDFSMKGRRNNIQRAMNIAKYERQRAETVIMSMVFPFNDQRVAFSLMNDVFWVYLRYSGGRGKDDRKVVEFQPPVGIRYVEVQTDKKSIDESVAFILEELKKY